jgi:hypothetical protein
MISSARPSLSTDRLGVGLALALLGLAALSSVACAPGQSVPQGGTGGAGMMCSGGRELCGGSCVNTNTDGLHCGGCNKPCVGGGVCDNRMCVVQCTTAGTRLCGTSCVDTTSNSAYCGGCATSCRSDQACVNSVCSCPSGQSLCNGVCAASCSTGTGGGTGTGGSATGTGGAATGTGGTGTGSGGSVGTGGTGPGTGGTGPGTGGSGAAGASGTPAGWWTSKTWHGCAWTGIDTVANTTTTNMPRDFLTKPAADPYCVKGTVNPTYESVALLGFNLNETPTGDPNQCAYKASDSSKLGPPGVQLTGNGIAVGFKKATATDLRIQIQTDKGGMPDPVGAMNRWCYTIKVPEGPVFAPFSEFKSECWSNSGTVYAGQPISAVVFLTAGTLAPTPFDYCISTAAFNTGAGVADAPPNPTGGGPLMGTIGGAGATDLDFQRVKVSGGGRSYIIQNNNWGDPNGTNQTLRYSGNSFTITQETGSAGGDGVPRSFPSIFIGANGDTRDGSFSTHKVPAMPPSEDNLPKQVSTIQSVMSTFRYNRNSGDYNATYDIWFAQNQPTVRYNDGISGFVMVWLYKPGNRQPIGSVQRQATINGAMYDVWVGPRGAGSNAPVVSYVARSSVLSFSGDLMPFIRDAAMHGIQSSWYLTDVFAGFEIWSGGGTNGLAASEFTAVVQ